ncbi:MAG: hypothetical protein M0Q96_03640 [Candidatus Omnitrophica bacterium]|jgi:hypothetical protein|nr:hypothetical protein [Candidatus Omnitrophota bacterium]
MFIHAVLFEVKPSQVAKYRRDSLMWARYTKKAKGFISYRTMKRYAYPGQYLSVYQWQAKLEHDRFMRKYHDWLVGKSAAKVKVLGYFNFKSIDCLK